MTKLLCRSALVAALSLVFVAPVLAAGTPAVAVAVDSNASVFDSEIYRGLFSTSAMRGAFSDRAAIAHWLRFEAELAAAQAELGLIPASAAAAIAAAARLENIDLKTLNAGTHKVGRPIDPLLSQVKKKGGKEVAAYLHLGATTQDVLDTGTVLQVRDGLDLVQGDLKKLSLRLADLSAKYRATPAMARSNGQDAIPTTFGMQLASYMVELRRHNDRINELRPRVLVGQYGSAVGTLSAAGDQGLVLRANLMKRLGLSEPDLSWNASRDNFAETVQTLALINGTLKRVANDINLWSRTADNSINEGEGGASSTMPQKRNPRASEFMGGIGYLSAIRAAGALTMLDQSETRQGAPWISEWSTIPEMFMLTSASLERANRMFEKIIVRESVMLERFNDSQGYAMSEALMSELAPRMGRGPALDAIKAAIKAASAGTPFREVVLASPALTKHLKPADLDRVLEPKHYLGAAPQMVDAAVAKTRTAFK
ncbi:MAG: adenylosuccinate lyase family protein [Burkholderiaceae bacterium]